MHIVENLNIRETKAIVTPNVFKKQFPLSEKGQDFIYESRQTIQNILSSQDNRQFIVVVFALFMTTIWQLNMPKNSKY